MPTYEYQCDKCRQIYEIRQRISEPALTVHDGCGGPVHRLLSAAPFILKGEGWYVTDYPSEARKKAKESEKGAATGGDTKPAASTDTKSDTKAAAPAAGTETKAAAAPASSPAKSSD
ncbi:MAG: FmdB family zinc ribbon protein [Candidatus Rokuibacteriota bacterium]